MKREKKILHKRRFNKRALLLGATIILGVLLFTYMKRTGSVLPAKTVDRAQRAIQLGMWTEGFFDAKTRTLHTDALTALETLIDKKVSIAHYYRGWEYLMDPILISEFTEIRRNGWIPMLNVNPYFFPECPPTTLPLYKAIAQGECDAFLNKAAANLRLIDKPFYLLFAWEMTNKDLEWSVKYSGSTSEDFVAAWRHIHDVFRREKVRNIIWVFCPNIQDSTSIAYENLYPGDSYVDWVGIDGYNWGTTQSWSQWAGFAGVFTSSYNELVKVAPNKPVMIAEVNSTDQGGDKASWYKDMFMKQIPYNFPHIQAVIIYNEDRSVTEGVNWKIDVTSESLAGFKEGIHAGFYK